MQVSDLKPNPKNPRVISPERLDMLKKSLAEYGDLSGIVWNSQLKLLATGHQRIRTVDPSTPITVEQKYKKPTKQGTVAEGFIIIEGERFKYREVKWGRPKHTAATIAANNLAGEWDEVLLAADIEFLKSEDYDLDLTMFEQDEITGLVGAEPPDPRDDEAPEPPKVAKSKLGQIYQLGQHRLMCGDSTDQVQVEKLMNGKRADITFTSPPYNLGKFEFSGPKSTNPALKGKYLSMTDDLSPKEYEQFIFDVIQTYLPISDSVLINIGMMEGNKRPVMNAIHRNLEFFKETLYWKKSTSTPHIVPGIVTTLVEPIFCFGNHPSRQFKNATFKGNCNNTIEGSNASGNEYAKIHAATFPVYLPEWVISNFSRGDVIDPFGGSGSTLIACEKTKRKCFMMELDPIYVDVIIERWEKYTGKTAKLISK